MSIEPLIGGLILGAVEPIEFTRIPIEPLIGGLREKLFFLSGFPFLDSIEPLIWGLRHILWCRSISSHSRCCLLNPL